MKYFGTDGIRDRVKGPLLEPGFVYRLGRAIGQWLNQKPASASRHVAIGRDTRASGANLFLSLSRGLDKEGVRIFDAGVCPTPATAVALRILGLDLGIVLTASHNPASDNGIKLFGPGGCKLRTEDEEAIETLVDAIAREETEDPSHTPAVRYFEARRHYLETYKSLLPDNGLMGMRIVLDCANGATYRTSGEMLTRAGAQVIPIGCDPDGDNINDGLGSEHPEAMCQAVREQGANLGIAHDGDGDRVILCDHQGQVVDGDAVMAILGNGWARRGELEGKTVVATIMSNLGLEKCLRPAGVNVMRTGVGDRQVFYAMRKHGFVLGGESSGHFIAMNYLPTGDGLLAALLVLREMLQTDGTLAELAALFQPFPQLKQNLIVSSKPDLESLPELQADLKQLQQSLGQQGRILLRYSGTEPKVRLLAEAEDEILAQKTFDDLAGIVARHLPVNH
ncbi:MAG: phosphoglucosamine mutase [Puniceicoccaceae bacterium]